MRNDAVAWHDLITTNVGDNDGAVRSDAQLDAVRITDPYPFLESECGLQPRYRRSYVWVDEHRSDGGGRRRTIRQHGRDSNGRRAQGHPNAGPGHCARGTPHGQTCAKIGVEPAGSASLDAVGAVSAIRRAPEIDPGRVGFLGASAAGWIAP